MINNKKVIAVILARGGSKRIPNKNIIDINGKPLLVYSIECAKGSKYIDEVIVSSDSQEILDVAKEYGVTSYHRSIQNSGDKVYSVDALQETAKYINDTIIKPSNDYHERNNGYNIIIELNNCCPLRTSEDVDSALIKYLDIIFYSHETLQSYTLAVGDHHPIRHKKIKGDDGQEKIKRVYDLKEFPEGEGSRSQEMEKVYYRNGAIYIMNIKMLLEDKTRMGMGQSAYIMPEERSFNIDTPFDLEIVRGIIERRDTLTLEKYDEMAIKALSRGIIERNEDVGYLDFKGEAIHVINTKPKVRCDAPLDFMPDIEKEMEESFEMDNYSADYKYHILNPGTSEKYEFNSDVDRTVILTPSTGRTHVKGLFEDQDIYGLSDDPEYVNTISASAEYTWGLMLSLIRKIPQSSQHLDEWRTKENDWRGMELQGKTCGIIGYGRIGKRIAKYAEAFDMNVIWNDNKVDICICGETSKRCDCYNIDKANLQPLLKNSDIVFLCINYKEENYRFFDTKKFNLMKKSAYFINTSRGECVNQYALIDALENEKIKAIAVDVVENEQDDISKNLLVGYSKQNPDKLLITPHIAGATIDSQRKAMMWCINKIKELEGME